MRPTPRSALRSIAAPCAATALLLGCSSGSHGTSTGSLEVFAASSLTAAFQEIGEAFRADHPDVDVVFNFAASSELASQIVEGAPVDVFASADRRNMDKVADAGFATGSPTTFATNSMEIIVAAGNPKGISSLSDLSDPGLIVVLCAEEVPCGKYAIEVLDNAGVDITPKSFEQSAKAAVAKVVSGEADAAIVFHTDVIAAGGAASGVDIPSAVDITAEYPIAVTSGASSPAGAAAFVAFVTSTEGRAILTAHGFGPP